MAGQILVPLKRHDRIEEIIPYIETIAKPGMRVVFLIPYPVESRLWFRDHWVTTESTREAMLAGRRIMERYSWEAQRELAEQKVFLAREALRSRGVEITVDVYAGSLKRVVRSYTGNGDIYWIMMQTGSSLPMRGLLDRTLSLFGLLKRPGFSPMLLLHPDYGVLRWRG